jgi:hypothetical protein
VRGHVFADIAPHVLEVPCFFVVRESPLDSLGGATNRAF